MEHGDKGTSGRGHRDMRTLGQMTWGHGDTGTSGRGHGDMRTREQMDMETRGNRGIGTLGRWDIGT